MRKTMLAVASHATQVNAGDTFSEPHAISALAALAQPTRLAIFRLLIKHEPIGITAGVIAETVGAQHPIVASRHPCPRGVVTQLARWANDRLPLGRRGYAVPYFVSDQ